MTLAPMATLRALIWDVDGTLAESERDGHLPAFNEAFRRTGLNWQWDDAMYGELLAVTGGVDRMRSYAKRFDPQSLTHPDFEDVLRDTHRIKNRLYGMRVNEGRVGLRPGVQALIEEAARAGVRQAIATTTSRANVHALLDATLGERWPTLFEALVCGEDVDAKKPDPSVFHLTLDRLDLQADDCLAIEDSPNGLAAASAAGLRCLITESEYFRGADFTGSIRVVGDLDTDKNKGAGDRITLARLREWFADSRPPREVALPARNREIRPGA